MRPGPTLQRSERCQDLNLAAAENYRQRSGGSSGNTVWMKEAGRSDLSDCTCTSIAAITEGDAHLARRGVDVAVDEHGTRETTVRIRVCYDQHFTIYQNARERHDSAAAAGVPEVGAIA
jgi:hypothetical protein